MAMTDPRFVQTAHEEQTRVIPPEVIMRREQSLRFQRDGVVYASNGRIGVLKQVVVVQQAGEVTELVVMVEATGQTIVVPATLVEKTGGSAVFLRVDRSQFAEFAGKAPGYEKRRFRKARLRLLRRNAQRASEQNRLRAVAEVGRDFITIPFANRFNGAPGPVATSARGQFNESNA